MIENLLNKKKKKKVYTLQTLLELWGHLGES